MLSHEPKACKTDKAPEEEKMVIGQYGEMKLRLYFLASESTYRMTCCDGQLLGFRCYIAITALVTVERFDTVNYRTRSDLYYAMCMHCDIRIKVTVPRSSSGRQREKGRGHTTDVRSMSSIYNIVLVC